MMDDFDGLAARDAQSGSAVEGEAGDGLATPFSGRSRADAHTTHAAETLAAGDLPRSATHTPSVAGSNLAPLLAELKATWRMRQALARAERRLTQQVKAVERAVGGAGPISELATIPLAAAREPVVAQRKLLEKRLGKLSKGLPVWPWVESVRGFGPLSLAGIIAETGPLDLYANPAKVWKRMGLAVMPDGRQRLVPGAAALEHAYSPERRAIVWNLGEAMVKSNGTGPYRAIYLSRKAYEVERDPEIKPAKAHARAKRYLEKRLLLHLFRVWRHPEKDPTEPLLPPVKEASDLRLEPAVHGVTPEKRVPAQTHADPADQEEKPCFTMLGQQPLEPTEQEAITRSTVSVQPHGPAGLAAAPVTSVPGHPLSSPAICAPSPEQRVSGCSSHDPAKAHASTEQLLPGQPSPEPATRKPSPVIAMPAREAA